MQGHESFVLQFFVFLSFIHCLLQTAHSQLLPIPIRDVHSPSSNREVYIVHVQRSNDTALLSADNRRKWYQSFLPSKTLSSGQPQMVYTYEHAITGFAARLTPEELKAMKRMDGFVHAHRDRTLRLRTTHVNDFLGINSDSTCLMRNAKPGKGLIVGLLDTGVLPNHASFRDDGVLPPLPSWKGHCDFKRPLCNNKLVGARSFINGCNDPPLDADGHGTHTASIAAGNVVQNASVLGAGRGVASGIAPGAYLAVYKVCHNGVCFASDVLAGIDQAIADGVDVLSISLSDGSAAPFYEDSIAMGALSAIEKGIFVSCAAGNSGPSKSTIENETPWVLTVGASSMDRTMSAIIKLGNGEELSGETAYQPVRFTNLLLPIVYPGAAGGSRAKACSDGSLNRINVKGKVVFCHTGGTNTTMEKGTVVKEAGGVAMILMNSERELYTATAEAHVLPVSHVSYSDGNKIIDYLKSSSNPTATISFRGTLYKSSPAPAVASFSSRGPGLFNDGILKPDIVGPGANIIAAWPFPVGPPSLAPANDDNLTSSFSVISGTSLSAAALAGIAGLVKLAHPEWSPAMIKSAIMTTSDMLNSEGKPIADETGKAASFLAMGAGHVNPSKAMEPGLVYDIQPTDYIPYLCGLGYTDSQVSATVRRRTDCSLAETMTAADLNYPSISVSLASNSDKTVSRRVTNVGDADSIYAVQVRAPEGVEVKVYPERLSFSEVNESVPYNVYFSAKATGGRHGQISEGYLRWVSNKHVVRSPITVLFT